MIGDLENSARTSENFEDLKEVVVKMAEQLDNRGTYSSAADEIEELKGSVQELEDKLEAMRNAL